MTASDIPIAGSNHRASRTFNSRELSRTWIAVAQMAGDYLLLTTLSYLSLAFVIFIQNHEIRFVPFYLYAIATFAIAAITVLNFACSGVYDVFGSLSWRRQDGSAGRG